MQSILKQFYGEGFATLFFLHPIGFIKKVVKNRVAATIFSFIIRIAYTALVLYLAYNYLTYKLEFLWLK